MLRRARRSARDAQVRSSADRHPRDRGLRGDRLRGELGGHRALRAQQAGLAEDLPGPAERHPLARHLPAGLHADRPGRVRGLLRAMGAVLDGRGRARGGGDRRQDRPALGQPPPRSWPAAPGQRLGERSRAGARPARGRRQVERDRRDPGAARHPASRRLHRDARRDGLPEGHRRADPGQGRRLPPGAEGQSRPRLRGRARAFRAHLLRPRVRRAAGVRRLRRGPRPPGPPARLREPRRRRSSSPCAAGPT